MKIDPKDREALEEFELEWGKLVDNAEEMAYRSMLNKFVAESEIAHPIELLLKHGCPAKCIINMLIDLAYEQKEAENGI